MNESINQMAINNVVEAAAAAATATMTTVSASSSSGKQEQSVAKTKTERTKTSSSSSSSSSSLPSLAKNNNITITRLGPLRTFLYIVIVISLTLVTMELRGYSLQQQQQQSFSSSYYYLDKTTFTPCADLPSQQQRPQQSLEPTTTTTTTTMLPRSSTTSPSSGLMMRMTSNNNDTRIIMSSSPPPRTKVTNSSLAVIVLSRRDGFDMRQVIRETWGNGKDNIYFVVGQGCTVPPTLRAKDEGKNPICQVAARPLPNNYRELTQQQHDKEDELDKLIQKEQEMNSDMIVGTDFVDIYRTLPKKLKTAYTFVHDHLPTVEWVLKVDDDFFVRVDDFENYLMKNNNNNNQKFPNPRTTPYVVGWIRRNNFANAVGKWKEVAQYPIKGKYPFFPLGSAGHVVSRPVVEYIYQNQHLLFDYQGEDVSLGIWLKTQQQGGGKNNVNNNIMFGRPEKIFKDSAAMVNNKDCLNNFNYVVGHSLTMDEMRLCQEWTKKDALTPQQHLMAVSKLDQKKYKEMIKIVRTRRGGMRIPRKIE